MDPVEIRLARPEDVEAAVLVWERARRQAMPDLEARMDHSHEDSLRHFRTVLMQQRRVWVALERGCVVGLLAIAGNHLDQLYVDPPCQGRGIGTLLLDHAKELSPGGLELFTHRGNERARAFYERRGFSIAMFGVSPPPESEPDVMYQWNPG